MPTILRHRGYRFSFFAADGDEPQHVHVEKESKEAKYWLSPIVRLSRNKGFRPHDLNEIEKILKSKRAVLLKAWNDYFGR